PAVRAEADVIDPVRVSAQGGDLLAGLVPQPHRPVPAGGGQAPAVRAEADVPDRARVPSEDGDLGAENLRAAAPLPPALLRAALRIPPPRLLHVPQVPLPLRLADPLRIRDALQLAVRLRQLPLRDFQLPLDLALAEKGLPRLALRRLRPLSC